MVCMLSGGPSLELILNSYNLYANKNYLCNVTNSSGYKISSGSEDEYKASILFNFARDTSSKDLVYDCGKQYWICSPSNTDSEWYMVKLSYNRGSG